MRNTLRSKVNLVFDIVLKFVKRNLISVFKFPIIFGVLLNCIICQMYFLIVGVVFIKFVIWPRGSDVPFFKEVAFAIMVDKYPHSNIKFSFLNQARIFYVLLNDETVKFENRFTLWNSCLFCWGTLKRLGLIFFVYLFKHLFWWNFRTLASCFLLRRSNLNLRSFAVFFNQSFKLFLCLKNMNSSSSIQMSCF